MILIISLLILFIIIQLSIIKKAKKEIYFTILTNKKYFIPLRIDFENNYKVQIGNHNLPDNTYRLTFLNFDKEIDINKDFTVQKIPEVGDKIILKSDSLKLSGTIGILE
jgi:hypothetical protein